MRSLVLVLALALPAAAATPTTFTANRAAAARQAQRINVDFRNVSYQDRELLIGNEVIRLEAGDKVRVTVSPGVQVRLASDCDSKLKNTVLLEVSAADEGRMMLVR